MSWYLFKDAPAHQSRGKKVDGFSCKHHNNTDIPKPKINLSWGMNEAFDSRPQSNSSSLNPNNHLIDTVPATLSSHDHESSPNNKVFTETSEDEQ